MRTIIKIFILLLSFNSFSQENIELIDEPNLVRRKFISFYKDSWIPFNGNFINHKKKSTWKSKVENGIEHYAESYNENNELRYIIKNDVFIEVDSSFTKSEFKSNDKFIEKDELEIRCFKFHFFKDYKTGSIIKSNGIVKLDFGKHYYSKGVVTKIETYYDKSCSIIKSSYEVFHNEFGNLYNIESSYHGKYKLWNRNGEIVESGEYVNGKKMN